MIDPALPELGLFISCRDRHRRCRDWHEAQLVALPTTAAGRRRCKLTLVATNDLRLPSASSASMVLGSASFTVPRLATIRQATGARRA
jgi:hypothetical protein